MRFETKKIFGSFLLGLMVVVTVISVSAAGSEIGLDKIKHIHGIAVYPKDSSRLYLATHQGLVIAGPDGHIESVSQPRHDFMSFAPHPTDQKTLYASGHPVGGGNLGFQQSQDGGRTWKQLSPGVSGPVDFHTLAVSPADPKTIYGVYKGLQVSRDGGLNWEFVGPLPKGVMTITASAQNVNTLYAATPKGVRWSKDAGSTWRSAYMFQLPVSTVHVTTTGTVYAFVVGKGLLRTQEPSLAWKPINNQFGSQILLQLAVSPTNPDKIYALNQYGKLLSSSDGGKSWHRYTGDPQPKTQSAQKGRDLYQQNCISCHGVGGVGETYSMKSISDRKYIMAPALDDSMHAWHHTDEALVETILEGSKQTSRMRAWKDVLSRQDGLDIVAYMKSLWGKRALECQGPKHMSCM